MTLNFAHTFAKRLQGILQPRSQTAKSSTTTKAQTTPALDKLVTVTAAKRPLGTKAPAEAWTRNASASGTAVYANQNEQLNIDFTVERLEFPDVQTLDPRVVRIEPNKNNELHRHAHESLFIILAGQGEVRIGDRQRPVRQGDVAFVPRWAFHQTRNTSVTEPLVLLAITDFGFTSAVLGDYDKRTRLAKGGADAANSKEL
ncbi:MAG: cupin domain-containing protein [Leptolyngbyaceae cyanobacterium MO_188.B28]|nr:cupin domain-containing protein [Leptolyngbyaceae cyanobacterium MO_188.B28]